MDKLNICLVSAVIAPDQEDGSAKFFRGIYDYLKKRGHRVKLITGKWNVKLKDPNIIQIDLLRKSFFWVPQFSIKVFKFLKSRNFDIIHGNGPKGSFPLLFFNKNEFISTIHDLGPFETKFSRIPIEKFLIKQTSKKAKYITTCSEFIRREIKYFIPEININNIYNLYSAIEDKYKPYPKEAKLLKERLGIKGPVLLYIGRIAHYKGVNDIIAAYNIAKKDISNLNLIMGGIPDFSMEKIYQEWKCKYKDIFFVGFISEKEIPFYYSMGDIFVNYSSASEGFGLTPLEAIACGAPVICSSLLAFKEVLQDNAIFVPPKNPKLLAKEIVMLLKKDAMRENLVKRAQNFIKRYSWDEVGKKLEEVYFKFLSYENF
ncbi:MAG: glycosyltransferase family 4 protein [Promethearchaeota archaeon]